MDILRKTIFLLILVVVCMSEEPIVEGIGIYGNDTFDDWTLSRLMETRENKFYSFILGGRQRLDQRTLERDVTRIRDYYIQEGFLDVAVAANVVIRENGQKTIIHIDIEEGTRYYLKRYSIGGDGSSYFSKLGRKFTLAYQKPFNPGLVENDRITILREAQNRGHPYADVKSDWEKINGDSIEVRFHVKLDKKADFGEITYKNLTYTKKDFLDREVVINTGNPYSFDAITKTRENLYRTGLFNVVRVKADTSETQPDSLDMDLYLFEKEPRWLAVKAAVITDPEFDMTSDLTVEWGHRNIGGRAIGVAARLVPSFRMISQI